MCAIATITADNVLCAAILMIPTFVWCCPCFAYSLMCSLRDKYGFDDDGDCMYCLKCCLCYECHSIQIYDTIDEAEGPDEKTGLRANEERV
jgi:hypothetical protein